MLETVFEMFTRVDRTLEKTTGGLGIGLSLVRRLVQMHGGGVTARSEGEGRGCEFIVRLPAVPSAVPGDDRSAPGQPTRPRSRRRILVADDNVDSAESLGQLLDLLGYEARTAQDGLQALEVAETFRPDVVLLDIAMPRLNGHDACRRIREQPWAGNTVVVAMTGWSPEDGKLRSLDGGFDHHLVKPVDPVLLERLLATLKVENS
jgi:CheY-like chemotaxis protein